MTHLDWIRALICLPDQKRIASVSDDHVIKIWSLERAAVEEVLRGHSAEINCISITPDGRSLISGGDDRTLHPRHQLKNGWPSMFSVTGRSQELSATENPMQTTEGTTLDSNREWSTGGWERHRTHHLAIELGNVATLS